MELLNTRDSSEQVLVTGSAGFIGFHAARYLLERGLSVLGVDSVNDYYDPALKRARLAELQRHRGFRFEQGNLADCGTLSRATVGIITHDVVTEAANTMSTRIR